MERFVKMQSGPSGEYISKKLHHNNYFNIRFFVSYHLPSQQNSCTQNTCEIFSLRLQKKKIGMKSVTLAKDFKYTKIYCSGFQVLKLLCISS